MVTSLGTYYAIPQVSWALALGGQLTQIGLTLQEAMTGLLLIYFPPHCKSVVGTLYGNIRTHEDIPTFADMAMKGDFNLGKLISKTFKVEEINQVVEAMEKRQIIGHWVWKWGDGK